MVKTERFIFHEKEIYRMNEKRGSKSVLKSSPTRRSQVGESEQGRGVWMIRRLRGKHWSELPIDGSGDLSL